MSLNPLQGSEEYIIYSAITFRYLLDSLARPGKLNLLEYPTFLGETPYYYSDVNSTAIPLNLYALGALSTLLDGETSFVLAANGRWLPPTDPAIKRLALRTGAGAVVPNLANFALFCDGTSGGLLAELSMGSLVEPETSATAIYCVEQLAEIQPPQSRTDPENAHPDDSLEHLALLELSGPGISGKRGIGITGLGKDEIRCIQATRQNYPLGIDIYLVDASGRCLGLPRTTKITHLDFERG